MKRSNLKRKTPLRAKQPLKSKSQLKSRTQSLKRSGPLKPKSKSTARRERQEDPARRAFRGEFPICWFCQISVATDVHEIANGPARKVARGDRCTWAASCSHCNCHEVTDKAKWPIARQLAKKWIHDREWFHLRRFNEIRRGQRITDWVDVVICICRELDGDRL